jgi:hypothetical protein
MPALIFDLDGKLVDTVCAHVFAPDLFVECARRLDVPPVECYGADELAYRVYRDVAELRVSLDDLGVG